MRALQQLRAAYDLGPNDAQTAPLGAADDPDGLTLLAGRFYDTRVSDIRDSIEGNGGEIVVDVDEGWTLPRRGPVKMGQGSQRGSEERRRAPRTGGGTQSASAAPHRSL